MTALSLYKKAKQLVNQNKKVDKAEQGTEEVTKDYLAQIPVWKTANHIQEEKLEQALKDARDQSGNQIDAILVNSSRGAGIKIEFAFNSREKELKDHASIFKQLAASLANVLEDEPNLRVEIEEHACQVGTEKANMQVSAERAEYAKKLLMKEFPVFDGRVSVAAFGESKPVYVPKQGEKVDRNNPNLRQNRRVVIRIYLQSLNVFFHPSRYGSHAMERSRLALEAEMVAQDKAEVALRMAIFDSVVDVASYIPAIAPAARGFMLAIEGSKTAISAVKVIDSLMLDSFLEELKQSHEVVSELERLAKIHIELLNDLRRSKVDVGIECRSYQELITHLESEEVRNEPQIKEKIETNLSPINASSPVGRSAQGYPLPHIWLPYKIKGEPQEVYLAYNSKRLSESELSELESDPGTKAIKVTDLNHYSSEKSFKMGDGSVRLLSVLPSAATSKPEKYAMLRSQINKNVAVVYLLKSVEIVFEYPGYTTLDESDDYFELRQSDGDWSQRVCLRQCIKKENGSRLIRFTGWPAEVKEVDLLRGYQGNSHHGRDNKTVIFAQTPIADLLAYKKKDQPS
nr:OmpA family protein [Vibrio parahaemolyticus]